MAAKWHLVRTFLREATEDETFAPVADTATAYQRLRQIQRGHFDTATSPAADGLQQISSRVGETEFGFAVPADLTRADIMAIAEEAFGFDKEETIPEIRAVNGS
jgi:hypothetical protein